MAQVATANFSGTRNGRQVYTVDNSKQSNDTNASPRSGDPSRSFSRAKKLGVKVHRSNPPKQHPEHKNVHTQNIKVNDYFANLESSGNDIDDAEALRRANSLSVSDQNPHYHENGNSQVSNDSQDYVKKERAPKRKGAGFLGRNKRKSSF